MALSRIKSHPFFRSNQNTLDKRIVQFFARENSGSQIPKHNNSSVLNIFFICSSRSFPSSSHWQCLFFLQLCFSLNDDYHLPSTQFSLQLSSLHHQLIILVIICLIGFGALSHYFIGVEFGFLSFSHSRLRYTLNTRQAKYAQYTMNRSETL